MKLQRLFVIVSAIATCGCQTQSDTPRPITPLPPSTVHSTVSPGAVSTQGTADNSVRTADGTAPLVLPLDKGAVYGDLPPASIQVAFLHVTNHSASEELRGVFQITNTLDRSVYILHTSVTTSNQSGWSLLRRFWYTPGMIGAHERFLLETWVPPRGGPYRLEFRRRASGAGSEFYSAPFSVSPGPPMQQHDFPPLPIRYAQPG